MNLNGPSDYTVNMILLKGPPNVSRTFSSTETPPRNLYLKNLGDNDARIENNSAWTNHVFNVSVNIENSDTWMQIDVKDGFLTFNNPVVNNSGNPINIWGENLMQVMFLGSMESSTGNPGVNIRGGVHVIYGGLPESKSYSGVTRIFFGGKLQITSNQTLDAIDLNEGGELIVDEGVTLTINGSWIGGGTLANHGTIVLGGFSAMDFPEHPTSVIAMNNLTINNPDGITLDKSLTLDGMLTLIHGKLFLDNSDLTLSENSPPISGSPFGASNMIVTDDSGMLRKKIDEASEHFFPIGDLNNYTPVNLNFSSGTFDTGAFVSIKVFNNKHPNNLNTNHFLSRYWAITSEGISGLLVDLTANFTVEDIVGSIEKINAGKWNESWSKVGEVEGTTLNAFGINSFSDFSGIRDESPTLAGPDNVCDGSQGNFYETEEGFSDYVWIVSGGDISAGGGLMDYTATVTWNTSGLQSISVSYVDENGLDKDVSLEVSVHENPYCSIIGLTEPICPVTSIEYAGPFGMSSYFWSISGNATIVGEANLQNVAVVAGSNNNESFNLMLTVENGDGCFSDCNLEILVFDNETPVVLCPTPSNPYVADAGQCFAELTFEATATDNCGVASLVYSVGGTPVTFPYQFPAGTTTVDVVVTDTSGNTAECSFDVVVEDEEAPVIACAVPNENYLTDLGDCAFTVPDDSLDPTAFIDNCPDYTIANDYNNSSNLQGTVFPIGNTTVTWTVTDASGNVSTCLYDILVVDNELPHIICRPDTLVYTPGTSCRRLIQAPFLTPISYGDNCGVLSLTWQMIGANNASSSPSGINFLPNTHFNAGITALTYTITDVNGNVSSCSFTISVNDNIDPIVTCPMVEEQYTADPGVCFASLSFSGSATDNCAVDHIEYFVGGIEITFPHNFPVGVTTVTVIASDTSGNTDECSFSVNVIDTEPPVVTCPTPSISYNANPGVCYRSISFAATATDNCAVDRIQYYVGGEEISFPYNFPVGSTEVSVFATDIHDNSSLPCSFIVNVADHQIPQVECPPTTSFNRNTAPNSCTYTVMGSEFDLLGYSDNCAVTEVRYQLAGATIGTGFGSLESVELNHGTTSIRWFVSDAAGNLNQSCVLSVVVIDNVPPVFLNCDSHIYVPCPDDILPPSPLELTIFDNCGSATVEHYQDIWHGVGEVPGFCPDSIQRIYRATDASNNVAYCTQMIVPESPCGCQLCQTNVPHFWVDLTNSCDSVWTSPNIGRRNLCCEATSPERCISFSVKIGPGAVGFYVLMDGASPPGWYYQVNCDEEKRLGETLCVPPGEYHTITICKPGANRNIYTIHSVCGVILPEGIETRADCEGEVSVSGVEPNSVTYSNITGDYLHYLSSTPGYWSDPNGHDTVYFTPDTSAPAVIKYLVCGSIPDNPCADAGGTICDTLTLHIHPKVEITLDPDYLVFCKNDPKSIVASVTPTGVYEIEWYDINHNLLATGGVFTPNDQGEYYVTVADYSSSLPCSDGILNFQVEYIECLSCPDEQLQCSQEDVIVFNTLAEFVAAGASLNFPCEPLASSFNLTEIISDNGNCPEFLWYRYALQDICGNRDTCNVVVQINDLISPTFDLPGDSIQCVADIINATYNPNGTYPLDDVTYPRPDYFLLRTSPPLDYRLDILNLSDNCTLPDDLMIEWEIDYGDNGTTNITGTGQMSSYIPSPPHEGLYFPLGFNRITYSVMDSCGNFTTLSFTLEVLPRPNIIDNY